MIYSRPHRPRVHVADHEWRATRLCAWGIIAPLALVWAADAMAVDADSTGTSPAAPSSVSQTGQSHNTGGNREGKRRIEEAYPVIQGYGGATGYNDYVPSGPGTDNPLGFIGGFAPRQCAPNADRFVQLSVAGSETYSDNINLSSHDRKSDFVTAVAPRLDACSSTGRIRGQMSYQIEGVVYANESHYNDIYNDAQGSTTIDLIENHLFLDANTRYGQAVIDPSVGYSRSNIIRPKANKTTAWSSNISPYFVQSLGKLGRGMLRYRYGRAIYDDRGVPDTTVQSVAANLTSPDTADPFSWQAQAVTQSVKTSGGDEQHYIDEIREIYGQDAFSNGYSYPDRTRHFDSATLQVGYRVSRTLTLTALGGIEDDYHDNGDNDRWSAPRWQVGMRWESGANSLEANYGHRFYGASYSLSAIHHGRLVDLSLAYDEDPSAPGLDALNSVGSGSFSSIPSIGRLGGYHYDEYNGRNSLLNRGVYVQKRWRARVGIDTARTRTEITGFWRHYDYQSSNVPDRRSHGIELDVLYDLGPRTRLVPSARWEHYNRGFISNTSSDHYDAGVSLVRDISPSARVAVGYVRNWRDDDNGSGYRENRVTLQLRKMF